MKLVIAFFISQVLCNFVNCDVTEKNFYFPDDPEIQGIITDNGHIITTTPIGIDEKLVTEIFGPNSENTDINPTIAVPTKKPLVDDKTNLNQIKPSSQPPPVNNQDQISTGNQHQQQFPSNSFQPSRVPSLNKHKHHHHLFHKNSKKQLFPHKFPHLLQHLNNPRASKRLKTRIAFFV